MVTLNARGEVGDFLDTSQFIPGRSAYECVAYAASLIKYAGLPGKGPIGTVLQASNLAQYWYGREEGSNAASNTNGMSLEAMENMLTGMGLRWEPATLLSIQGIKMCLEKGTPVILCGAETGMHDLALGGAVPYGWTPTGNHAIVVSGMTPDGNLLVHDTASIDSSGVRPGPRHYDAGKMQIVSVTAVHLTQEEDVTIDLNIPIIAIHFTAYSDGWLCKNGFHLHGAIRQYYQSSGTKPYCGYSQLGLPKSEEISLDNEGSTKQYFERGCLVYDPHGKYGPPDGAGQVYPVQLYDNSVGTDPRLPTLLETINQLKAGAVTADPRIADYQGRLKQINTLSQV